MSTSSPVLQVRRLRADAAPPAYGTSGAAGLDLTAALDGPLRLAPGARAAVPTGLAVAIPTGYEGQVRPRSGLAAEHAVTVLNAPGTIDEDYRGEVRVLLVNLGDHDYVVRSGDRVAQLVVAPVTRVTVEVVSALADTERGEGGFGSTGR